MSRKVPGGNWLKGWQFWLQNSEAPDSYIQWAGLSAIAGATMRRVHTEWVYETLYPNQYIILVGPAGLVHKSATIMQVRKMLRLVGVPLTSESLTKEALIAQMSKRGDGITSALTALPDEFSDFVRPSGPPMLEFLTSIFNSPDEWEYTTRSRDTESISRPFLNLLAGTTERWIANEFDITFTEQGFASRTLFVHETEPRFRKARAKKTPEMYKMYDCLIEDLLMINSLEGEFSWDPRAEDWFVDWYEQKLQDELRGIDPKLKSYVARKPTHTLKLAMLISLMQKDELVLTLDDMRTAKLALDALEPSMAATFNAVGRNIYAGDMRQIYADILASGGMDYATILERYSSAMPRADLDDQLETLQLIRYIHKESKGTTIRYVANSKGGSV